MYSSSFFIFMNSNELTIYINRFLGDFLPIVPFIGVLLASQGLSLSSVSLVFLALAVSVMVFELPAGILADRISLKLVLVLSRIFKFLAFGVMLIEPSFYGFILGAVIWGLASSLDSGTFQSYVYCFTRETRGIEYFEKVYGRSMTASMVALLASAGISSQITYLGFEGLQIIGLLSLALCIVSTLLLKPVVKQNTADVLNENEGFFKTFIDAWLYIKHRPVLLIVIVVGVLAGAIKGSLDEYTSLLLIDAGVTIAFAGYVLFGLELLKTSSGLFAPYIKLNPFQQILILSLLGAIFITIGWILSPLIACVGLAFIIMLDAALWIHNDAHIQNTASDTNRSTVSSFKNLLIESTSALLFGAVWVAGDFIAISDLYWSLGTFLVISGIVLGIILRNFCRSPKPI